MAENDDRPQLSPQDTDRIVRTIIGEAGNQDDTGQAAVAAVILNRLRAGTYGRNTSEVVTPSQFEPWATRAPALNSIDPRSDVYTRAANALNLAYNGYDPTNGATHFLNPSVVQSRYGKLPTWAQGPGQQIGDHTFYAPQGPIMNKNANDPVLSQWGVDLNSDKPMEMSQDAAPPVDADTLKAWGVDPVAPTTIAPIAINSPITAATAGAASPSLSDPSVTSADTPLKQLLISKFGAGTPEDWWKLGGDGPDSHNAFSKVVMSAIRGGKDVIDTGAHGLKWLDSAFMNKGADLGLIKPEKAQAVANGYNQMVKSDSDAQTQFRQEYGDNAYTMIGRMAGQTAATIPALKIAGTVVGGLGRMAGAVADNVSPALGNAAEGIGRFLSGNNTFASSVAPNAAAGGLGELTTLSTAPPDENIYKRLLSGMATGGAMGPLFHGLGYPFRTNVDPATAQAAETAMDQHGIPLALSDISQNRFYKWLASAAENAPGGTPMNEFRATQRAAVHSEVASLMGETADRITPDVMSRAAARNSQVFESVAGRIQAIEADPQFGQRLTTTMQAIPRVLSDAESQPLIRNIDDIVNRVRNGNGYLNGTDYLALTKRGTPLERLTNSANPDVRQFAGEIRNTLDDALERQAAASGNTQLVQDLQQARREWRVMKTIEPIIAKSPDGDFSPHLLFNVLTSAERAYANRSTPLSDVARSAKQFLTPERSSGTAERSQAQLALNPLNWPMMGLESAANRAATNFNTSQPLVRGVINNTLYGPGVISRIGAVAGENSNTVPIGYRSLLRQDETQQNEPLRLTVHPR